MSGIHRSPSSQLKSNLPPQELLDDLCSRFVLNVPEEEQQSFERILFLVEYAHWFYEDNSVENNPSLKSFTLKEFTSLIFNNCDVLRPYVAHIDDIFKDFNYYKARVPVTGAIILDETYERCLLVKGWKGASWSFPRGKKNKDEEDHVCAIREVLEETGFDITGLLKEDEYTEAIFGQQRVRLYITGGVKDTTAFVPQTKKEISEISWMRLGDLQPASNEPISRGVTGLKLYMVAPFLASLKAWILKHHPPLAPKPDRPPKGLSVWKAKNNSIGISSSSMIADIPAAKPRSDIPAAKPKSDIQAVKPRSDIQAVKPRSDIQGGNPISDTPAAILRAEPPLTTERIPCNGFKNFRFDKAAILQAMESAFSAAQVL